jgi:hypothetical protein
MLSEDETEAALLGLRYIDQRGDEILTQAATSALAKISSVLSTAVQERRRDLREGRRNLPRQDRRRPVIRARECTDHRTFPVTIHPRLVLVAIRVPWFDAYCVSSALSSSVIFVCAGAEITLQLK